MANEISKIKLPGGTTEYTVKDNSAITNITRSGTTFTATKRDGTEFTFTQQDNNTTYTFATGDNNGQIKVTPSGGTAQNVSVKGLGAAAYKGTTTSVTSGSSDLVTSGAVYTAIDNLPEPMIFKGSLGTGGTITTLPTASSANEGFTYKVITAGTYASQVAKIGDLFISNGTDWIWIPSGDEPSGTVTSVAAGTGLDGGTITTSGTLSVKYGTAAGTACQGNDSRLSDARTPTSHTHGNIQNGGTLQTNDITIASGDKLVVTDSSDSAKVARTSISFDGSTATKALTRKGTWETFGTSNLAIGTTATTALAGNTKYAGASTAGGSATSAAKLDTATAGSAIQPCYFANGIPSACTYTLGKSVPSTAEFTDSKVAVTPTNPPSATWYFPVWDTGGGTHGLMANDGFKYCSMQGTESVAGYSIIQAGNNIATGTAGNKSGEVRIYSQTDYCSRLVMTSNPTGSRTHTLPNVDGTIGVFTATPTSGQVVVTDGTAGGFKTTGYTIATSVPNNAVFTDTTYTLSADTTHYKIKLTPSNGTAQSITVPYATISSQVGQISIGHSTKPMYLDAGVPKECTYTLGKSVPSNAVFTDTNNAVTQTDVTTSMDLRVLLSKSANDTTETDYVRKSSNLTFNPSTGTLTSTNFVGSLTGAASKLGTSDKGSATQPIYLVLGVPYACTYTLEKSVPSDAVFTDHYAWTDITGKPSSFTPASHTHGNIQNGGTLQTNDITIASGDKLVVTDSSDSSKVARTSISFDGSTTTKCLTQKGTWATFGTSNLALGTTASTALKGDTKYAGASTAGGDATTATTLWTANIGGSQSTTHTSTLKSYFDSNKATIPRNKTLSYYSSAYGNGSQYMGYFLSGYDTAPYGGFFVAHYDKAYYVGISNGNYTQNLLGRFTADPTSGQVVVTDGTTGGIKSSGYTIAKSVPSDAVFTDTNTHRPIQVNGTEILGNNTTALNLKAGSNVSVTNSSGTVTIAATDTNTTYTLSADTTNNKITLTPSSGSAQSITVPYATSAGGVAWGNVTGKPSTFTPASHTHGIADITWAGNANLKANASANNQEWSIDLTPGSYTGTYWQVWSAKNSKTILACYTDNNKVEVPNGDFYVTNGEVTVGYGIELGMASKEAAPHIDFHWNSSTGTDYTARIWQRGESTVDLIGKNGSTWGIWRAGSFSTQSSIHAKENIQDITVEDSRKLLQLRPVTFNYKNGGLTDQAGLIAEEVYLVMPKMVIGDINYNPEEPWNTPSIDYSKFVPYLIKMVQEQQKEIDELKEMINQ